MTNQYGNESITSLKGADRVRKRPAVIFGSDGIEGCEHSVFEILSNSIDEAREGFGEKIKLTRHKDHSITIEDNGRGCPVDFNEGEQKYNWELVYCELYAGGKYDNNNSEGHYGFSLGLNGLGSCATQYSSEYMDVISYRDGYKYSLHFEKGENVGGLKKEEYEYKHTGTTQTWKPDLDVFTDIKISHQNLFLMLKRQAVVNAGIEFIFIDEIEDKKEIFYYENGIEDYLNELVLDSKFTEIKRMVAEGEGQDRKDKPLYKVKVDIAYCFTKEKSVCEYYHNSSYLEHGGAPDKAVKNAFTYVFDKYLREKGKYIKGEKKITFNDVEDTLALIISSFSTMTSYENQTKKAINNKFIQSYMTDLLKEKIEIYLIENSQEAEKIATQILVNKRSREKAEKTRLNIRKKLSQAVDLSNRVDKFVNCKTKDIEERELYIVEGDSALGATKLARDSRFQGLMPVRGKILNCLKADYNRIFKSDVIIDLLRVLGCGIEINSKHNKEFNTFDMNNLKWGKIIICTDADVDGFQIRTLILTMLYRLTPSLIEQGRVYIVESPLFEIEIGSKTLFAYSETEKNKIIDKYKNKKCSVQRSKGLGENEPEMMWLTTMSPDTRKLIKVTPEGFESTLKTFECFLGEDILARKSFIETHGHLYMDMIDLS